MSPGEARAEMRKLLDALVACELVRVEGTEGCSEAEVSTLDAGAARGRLPELYREFLLALGRTVDGTFMGSYLFTLEYLGRLEAEGRALARVHGDAIPPDAFFFATYELVDFFFFRTGDAGDDPAVYWCSERRAPQRLFASFRRFLGEEGGELADD